MTDEPIDSDSATESDSERDALLSRIRVIEASSWAM